MHTFLMLNYDCFITCHQSTDPQTNNTDSIFKLCKQELPTSDFTMSPSQIQNSCAKILNTVRQSGLNFSIQETPYSFFVTVRKSVLKSLQVSILDEPETGTVNLASNAFTEELQSRCLFLEQSNSRLKSDFEEAVHELEVLQSEKNDLSEHLTESKDKNDIVGNNIKVVNEEKRALQIKHERICSENKNLKNELESTKADLVTAVSTLKTTKKEAKDSSHQNEKKTGQMEEKIKVLEDFKRAKMSEEKNLRNKIKKVEKKLKSVHEKEAELVLQRKSFMEIFDDTVREPERNNNQNVEVKTASDHLAKSVPKNETNCSPLTSSLTTSYYTADITTYPSMVAH
jgi:hypothetical protein